MDRCMLTIIIIIIIIIIRRKRIVKIRQVNQWILWVMVKVGKEIKEGDVREQKIKSY